jgi:hypothetical protein
VNDRHRLHQRIVRRARSRRLVGGLSPSGVDEALVVPLGRGVVVDVFVTVDGALTAFLSIDGRLLTELTVLGEA